MSEIYPETPGTAPDSLSPYGIAVTGLEDILDLDDSASSWDEARAIASEAATRAVALSTAQPEPAKVIVVTDAGGREHRYAAPNFGMLHDGTLVIGDKTGGTDLRVDAMRAPGYWAAAHKDGALKDGPGPYFHQGKKLAIALDALRDVRRELGALDEPGPGADILGEIVDGALDRIAELDL